MENRSRHGRRLITGTAVMIIFAGAAPVRAITYELPFYEYFEPTPDPSPNPGEPHLEAPLVFELPGCRCSWMAGLTKEPLCSFK